MTYERPDIARIHCECTWTTRGIMPGSVLVPCMVYVFPEDVTPYANTVTV